MMTTQVSTLMALEGKTGKVEAIKFDEGGRRQLALQVRTRCGQEVCVSPGLVWRVNEADFEGLDRCWTPGTRLTHRSMQGTFSLIKRSGDQLLLQHDYSSAPLVCSVDQVQCAKLSAEGDQGRSMTALLRPLQHEAVSFFLAQRKAIGYLPPGSGKTVMGFSLFLRMLHDRVASVRLEAGEVFLIITDANLVEEVWLKQACRFGMLDLVHALSHKHDIEEHVQCVVASFHAFSSQLKPRDDADDGDAAAAAPQAWGRRIKGLYVDEAHRLCGDAVWTRAVRALTRHLPLSIGVTGTLFTNDPAACANLCYALSLPEAVQHKVFWSQPGALHDAANRGCVFVPTAEALAKDGGCLPPRPVGLPWLLVPYERSAALEGASASPAVKSVVELLGCSLETARQFHSVDERHAESSRRRQREYLTEHFVRRYAETSSKMRACVGAVRALLEGELHGRKHTKLFISVMYLDSVLIVMETLRYAFPQLALFEYHGLLTDAFKHQQLKDYLDHPCTSSQSAIVVTVAACKLGLNITNGDRSPTAHLEVEQAHLASDRFQLQQRIDRPGNPFPVQLVVLEGSGTQTQRTVMRQAQQAQLQAKAGCGIMRDRLGMQTEICAL